MFSIANLSIRTNEKNLVNHLSFTMLAGERWVVLGANGCGKSSLLQACARAAQDATLRIVVLTGAGGAFCAGGSLGGFASLIGQPLQAGQTDPLLAMNRGFGDLLHALCALPQLLVCRVDGAAMGGGFGLACCADVAIASDTASFRLPETSLGVVPAQIAPFLVERLGYSQAKRLAVTGGRLDAAAALALGLVHEVTHTHGLEAALDKVLNDILACAPGALAATKALMQRARLAPAHELVQDAAAIFAQSAQSAEGIEGMTAFIQKRKPNWTLT